MNHSWRCFSSSINHRSSLDDRLRHLWMVNISSGIYRRIFQVQAEKLDRLSVNGLQCSLSLHPSFVWIMVWPWFGAGFCWDSRCISCLIAGLAPWICAMWLLVFPAESFSDERIKGSKKKFSLWSSLSIPDLSSITEFLWKQRSRFLLVEALAGCSFYADFFHYKHRILMLVWSLFLCQTGLKVAQRTTRYEASADSVISLALSP